MTFLSLLKKNLKGKTEDDTATDTVRTIANELDKLDAGYAKFVACFAYLLSRTARADNTISPEETHLMEKIIVERGGLPEEQAIVVVQMAKTLGKIFGGTEDYLVAKEFKDLSNLSQRLQLLDCLYAVAASHELISTVEDNEISQIADELRIEHKDFIAIRSRYRDQLAVLKQN